jgi:predicted pyridoxine 5'-phosphate oxidase superfamily flavin-nucleotide-binding protein
MRHRFAEIAFSPAAQELQRRHGSRGAYARMQARAGDEALGSDEVRFLAEADSFFLASVSETGWPYVQHRGGPRGFIKVLGPTQIAFADFRGNRQYVSAGNAASNDRVALIVMDYVEQRRLKLLGRLRFVDVGQADPELVAQVELRGYPAQVERVALIDVMAFDWNCPQHITQRFTLEQVEEAIETVTGPLRERIRALEARLATVS